MRPEKIRGSARAMRRCKVTDMRGLVFTTWSAGRPKMYFGTTYAPERVDRKTVSDTVLRASSETMSTALLPMPTTSTRLPYRSSGVLGSMYSCEWMTGPSKDPGKSGWRGFQWCPLQTSSASKHSGAPPSSVIRQPPCSPRSARATGELKRMCSRRENASA